MSEKEAIMGDEIEPNSSVGSRREFERCADVSRERERLKAAEAESDSLRESRRWLERGLEEAQAEVKAAEAERDEARATAQKLRERFQGAEKEIAELEARCARVAEERTAEIVAALRSPECGRWMRTDHPADFIEAEFGSGILRSGVGAPRG